MSNTVSWAERAFAGGGAPEVKRQARRLVGQRDGWSCRYCGRALAPPPRGTPPTPSERAEMATLEHLTPPPRRRPRQWQDWADLANLGLSCAPCNEDKGALADIEYRLVLVYRHVACASPDAAEVLARRLQDALASLQAPASGLLVVG